MRVSVIRNVLDWAAAEVFVASPGQTLERLCPPEMRDLSCVEAFVDGTPVLREEWDLPTSAEAAEAVFVLKPQNALPGLLLFFQVASIAFVARTLFKGAPSASDRGNRRSASYSFGGLENSRIEGLPVQMIYGRHRVGGQIINEWTESLGVPSTTDLYTLVAFGHGPVDRIGNISTDSDDLTGPQPETLRIEDNPAENYDDITSWVRMGTTEQVPIPGFHRVYQNLETGQRLRGKSSNSSGDHGDLYVTDLYGPDPYNQDWDPAWDTWGETFGITEPSDGVRVKVAFERGLFKSNSDGTIGDSFFKVQFRYRELDGGNNPIDTGGPNSDGWVRVGPEATLSPNQSEFFERDFDVGPLLDPQTWTVPVPGNVIETTGVAAAPFAPVLNPAVDYTAREWWAGCWFRLDTPLPASANDGDEYMIFGNYDAAQSRGFSISFRWEGGQFGRWELDARVSGLKSGSPATVIAQTFPGGGNGAPLDTGTWRHFAFSYESEGDGGDDRLRLWQGKNLMAERRDGFGDKTVNFRLSDASTPRSIRLFASYNSSTNFEGKVDDLVFLERDSGQGFIDERVDDKQTLDESDPLLKMRARWKYDEGAGGTGAATQDILVNGQQWFSGMSQVQTQFQTGGQVLGSSGGTPKRMKIRLEALRLNYDMNRDDIFDDGDMVRLSHYLDEALSYPTTPLLGLKIRATEQLNTTVPRTSIEVRGLICPFWNGNGAAPTGFRWTANPAWVVADILTNNDYGLGNRFGFFNLEWDSFLAWALYCDEAVYDGSFADGPDEGGGWADILFDNTTTGPDPANPSQTITRGSLEFYYAGGSNTPPGHFKIGRFVRPSGVSTVGGGADINVDDVNVRGYEIIEEPTWNGSSWLVRCYWDRLSETDPWTTGTLLSTHQTVDGSATGGHHRFEFNAVFDEERDAWEAILDVCATGRAIPIKEGKQIRIAYNAPLPTSTFADHIIGRGDIVDGSFRIDYSGPQDKPLVYEIEYWDEDELYERQIWRSISPELTNADESSAEDMRTESIRLFGVTHRAQAERHGNFLHNTNRLVKRVGEFRVAPSALRVEPGDVALISHDILPRGVSGRAAGTGNPRQVIVTEAFEILPSTTYNVYVRDYLSDVVEKRVLDTAITGPGSYPDGGTLEVTADFTMRPVERLSSYVLVEDGQELRARITETTIEDDLQMVVRWSEYAEGIYADDAVQTETTSDFFGPGSGNINTPDEGPVGADRPNDKTLPDGPTNLRVSERMLADAGPGRGTEIVLSWGWPAGEQARIASVRIFARALPAELTALDGSVAEANTAWSLAGEVDGQRRGASISLPFAAVPGETVQLALQAVTLGGTRRQPIRCPSIPYRIVGAYRGPEALSGAAVEMDSGRARYSWAQTGRRGLEVEVRRGGWVLGQPIARVGADGGKSPLLEDWAGSVSGAEFPLLFASRDSSGQYGARSSVLFTPTPDVLGPAQVNFDPQAWEDYADGWVTDSAPPSGDPTLTNLVRHADGYLEFTGSATQGIYTTWDPAVPPVTPVTKALTPHQAFIEASVEAEQVHPLEWVGAPWAWGDPRYERWTWEGPAWTVANEDGNTTLTIEWRFSEDGTTYSDWALFRPGAYRVVDHQFRLVVERPDSDYQVKIHRFHTRASLIRSSATERDAVSAYLQREAF